MNAARSVPSICFAVLLVVSGCTDDEPVSTSFSPVPEPTGSARGGQGRLEMAIANADFEYVSASKDPWLRNSYVTEAATFDIVVTNRTKHAARDLYLLVVVPEAFVQQGGWEIQVGDVQLTPDDFVYTDPNLYGFDRRVHGIYPPKGTGRFFPYPKGDALGRKSSWTVPIVLSPGGVEGFKVHFDVGSDNLSNRPSCDVTAVPTVLPPPLGACCIGDGSCRVVTESECTVVLGGTFLGVGTLCEPNTCPQPEACCFEDGRCEVLLESVCIGLLGSPQGPGTSCDPNPCPQPEACCFEDSHCENLFPSLCEELGGVPQGAGVLCTSETCSGGD